MAITKTLTDWYSINKRDFPWRNTKDPYRIWLSEIILQQTQIKQGLPYFNAFVSAYPTVFELANAKESEVLKLWQGLGYYSRARNLHATAKYVAETCKGVFPTSYKELKELKGVGDYTASAIASICYNEAAAVLDGNVYRVLSRYYGIDTPINTTLGFKTFKTIAQEILSETNPAKHNQAIMDFGSTQCKPSSPECSRCPLQSSCVAYRKDLIGNLPVKLKAKKPKTRYFNFIVFITDNEVSFLEKRKASGIWQNLYQFPLIESKDGLGFDDVKLALQSHDLVENQDFSLSLYNKEEVVHKLSHQHLYTKFWIVKLKKLSKPGISISKIADYPVPVVIGNFIQAFNF